MPQVPLDEMAKLGEAQLKDNSIFNHGSLYRVKGEGNTEPVSAEETIKVSASGAGGSAPKRGECPMGGGDGSTQWGAGGSAQRGGVPKGGVGVRPIAVGCG